MKSPEKMVSKVADALNVVTVDSSTQSAAAGSAEPPPRTTSAEDEVSSSEDCSRSPTAATAAATVPVVPSSPSTSNRGSGGRSRMESSPVSSSPVKVSSSVVSSTTPTKKFPDTRRSSGATAAAAVTNVPTIDSSPSAHAVTPQVAPVSPCRDAPPIAVVALAASPTSNASNGHGGVTGGGANSAAKLSPTSSLASGSPPQSSRTATAANPFISSAHASFSSAKNEEFVFTRPPECPVFEPSEEEFKNPLAYISKIRYKAERYGICKIRPPKSWTPPFTVDVDKLRFTPRVQRLNELEAKTRVKLNFLDQIAKFWELQGSSLKIPMVERKALDLYTLHRVVQEEGGMEQTTKDRKWSKVSLRMGYPAGKGVGTILKGHYERILHPFDLFALGKTLAVVGTVGGGGGSPGSIPIDTTKTESCGLGDIVIKTESVETETDYKPHGIESRQQIVPPKENTTRRSKRFANSSSATCGVSSYNVTHSHLTNNSHHFNPNSENIKRENDGMSMTPTQRGRGRPRKSSTNSTGISPPNAFNRKTKPIDPLAKYICHICNRGDIEEAMLLCDGCDDSYHTFCLIPPLSDVPKGDWRCPKCLAEEVSKPIEAFGFEQAQREYTLQQFGEMADQFKADYFNMSVHLVPTDLVEREFWRIVSCIDEDVTVEYGADLHTMDHGSGFPTKSSLYLLPGDQEYAESSWNLNNLPLLEESILGHINADISGMKVPWMYVGMCFATFCWHNEDHWSYSINYLHWGEPKTWYGVPGYKAELFEQTMKSAAPELFASQPDLLHQLVTIMNPNILMNAGVPVFRTDQHAGEFVVTFPRAYHAGFNQGYNFAEAVNFAPADWMKMGRECIKHYSTLRRFCVFSHDELVCKMALEPDRLNLGIATACYLDMAEMVDSEKKLRKSLLEWGITKAERSAFELIPDDERQCEYCKTTVFLSAVTCTCTNLLVCSRHYTELCKCPPESHILKYRYTLDELPLMLKKLKVKAESFENWLSKVRDVLDPSKPTTITLEELQELAQEAEEKKFPSSMLLERLNAAVLEAEKCVTVIQQLDINKMRTRTRNAIDAAKYKLTLDELDLFVQEIDSLYCVIQEGQSVRELQALGQEFLQAAREILSKSVRKTDQDTLEKLIEDGSTLCIELADLKLLRTRLQQVAWYNRVREFRDNEQKLPLIDIQNLLQEGLQLAPDTQIEVELCHLQEIVSNVEDLEVVVKRCLDSEKLCDIAEVELILERADELEGELPSRQALKDALKKAKDWLQTVESLQSNESYPYFHTLENLVNRGKNIPFELDELKCMQEHLESANAWKARTAQTFLKDNSTLTLLDVLSPRSEAIMYTTKAKKKPMEEQFNEEFNLAQMVNTFKNAEEKEIIDMRALRKQNLDKSPLEDKYCKCKRKFQGLMYQCQLCKDWFHEACVPPPKNPVRPRASNSASPASSVNVPQLTGRERDRDPKYLCLSCMRSRRPRLETILSLLVSLQKLPIRLPEGEALQCLTERAMNWQDRVRQAFTTEEVVSALAQLSSISQKTTTATGGSGASLNTAATGTEKTPVSSHARTSATKRRSQPNSPRKAAREQPQSDNEDDDESHSWDEDGAATTSSRILASPSSPSVFSKIEHAYSVPVPQNVPNSPGGTTQSSQPAAGAGESRSSTTTAGGGGAAATNKSEMPLIVLSKSTKETLDSLMMEGDLMEVSLDETLHIWRIMNAAKPARSDLADMYQKHKLTQSYENLVKNKKKRSSDDHSDHHVVKRSAKDQSSASGQLSSATKESTSVSSPAGGAASSSSSSTASATVGSQNTPNTTSTTSAAKLKRGRKMKLNRGGSGSADKDAADSAAETPMSSSKAGAASGSASAVAEPPKKRKRGKKSRMGRKMQAALVALAAAAAASTSDEDEECSAHNCARPGGREVDWVQCDGGCNKWFHMYCVGLDKDQLKPDEDYICKRCKSTRAVKVASRNDGSAADKEGDEDNTRASITDDVTNTSTDADTTTATTTTTTAAAAGTTATTSLVGNHSNSTHDNGVAGGGGNDGGGGGTINNMSNGGGDAVTNKRVNAGGGRQKSSHPTPTTTTGSSSVVGSSIVVTSTPSPPPPTSSSSSSTSSSSSSSSSTPALSSSALLLSTSDKSNSFHAINSSSGNMFSSTMIGSCGSPKSSISSSNKNDNILKNDCDPQPQHSSSTSSNKTGTEHHVDDDGDHDAGRTKKVNDDASRKNTACDDDNNGGGGDSSIINKTEETTHPIESSDSKRIVAEQKPTTTPTKSEQSATTSSSSSSNVASPVAALAMTAASAASTVNAAAAVATASATSSSNVNDNSVLMSTAPTKSQQVSS